MRSQSACLLLGALAVAVKAAPQPWDVVARQADDDNSPASIPQFDNRPNARAAAVAIRNQGYVYGPSLIGEAAPFPNGTLGNARSKADMDLWGVDRELIDASVGQDAKLVGKAIMDNGGLKSLDDYANILYKNQWELSNPLSVTPGIMTNYTQDLLFSMERLSQNPYPVQLVKPDDKLPFEVPDEVTSKVAGASLEELRASGSLFVVDHSYQAKYPKTTLEPKRYGAACTAYFFIHPKTKDFLPLAIKTNVGNDLIYTPLDDANDWLLAKMMFNVNDMFHSQMFHLVVTHDVSESVHQAALHTMSEHHPIMLVLDRLMLQGYSSRIVGEQLCFNPGGHWDQLMYVNNVGCRQYVTETWPTNGAYQAGYLDTDLQKRGLINEKGEFPFKNFPFYEDASVIREGYRTFFKSFVDSYYDTDRDLARDHEVQNWLAETSTKAKLNDFPQEGTLDKEGLVDVLTHFGFIVSVVHHALNGGDPVGSKATLPFHLPALYAPVPAAKGVKDLVPFLPPPENAVHYIGFIASFNRPFYATSDRTLEHAFSNDTMLHRLNEATNSAAATFMSSMEGLSQKIKARVFDSDGLSMGMPFVYRTLDPNYIPFFCAV